MKTIILFLATLIVNTTYGLEGPIGETELRHWMNEEAYMDLEEIYDLTGSSLSINVEIPDDVYEKIKEQVTLRMMYQLYDESSMDTECKTKAYYQREPVPYYDQGSSEYKKFARFYCVSEGSSPGVEIIAIYTFDIYGDRMEILSEQVY